MRDDLASLFDQLLIILKEKTLLIERLFRTEKDIFLLMKHINENEERLTDFVVLGTELINHINVIDFEISGIKNSISEIAGVKFNNILHNKLYREEHIISQCINELNSQYQTIAETVKLKNSNLESMKIQMDDYNIQIDEIIRLQHLNYSFKKYD